MLANLQSNAIRFAPPKSVVRLNAASSADAVRLSMSDPGPGIPAHHVPPLFRKFSHLQDWAAGAAAGSGLGLYLVRTLGERIGARVGYTPNAAGGRTFCIDRPKAPNPATAERDASCAAQRMPVVSKHAAQFR